MSDEGRLSCPVCNARFRGTYKCSRCSANLTPLMLLAARAYAPRHAARESLKAGDREAALCSAETAQTLHATAEGRFLQFACALAVDPKNI